MIIPIESTFVTSSYVKTPPTVKFPETLPVKFPTKVVAVTTPAFIFPVVI